MKQSVFLVLCYLLFNFSVFAQSSQNYNDFSQLTLEMKFGKERFVVFEPLAVTFTLKNSTNKPVEAHQLMNFESNLLKIFVLDGSQKREMLRVESEANLSEEATFEIKPGEELRYNALLTLDLDKAFPTPGKYKIQAELYPLKGKTIVISNIVTIEIEEPKGTDLEAYKFLISNRQEPHLLLDTGDLHTDPARVETISSFLSSHPASPYSDYIAYTLGIYYFYKEEYKKSVDLHEQLFKKQALLLEDRVIPYLIVGYRRLRSTEKEKFFKEVEKKRVVEIEEAKKKGIYIIK